MAATVSVGSAVLFCRVAFRLGEALPSQRSQALGEIAELDALISSLDHALAFIDDLTKSRYQRPQSETSNDDDTEDDLAAVIGCCTLLQNVRVLVKWRAVSEHTNAAQDSQEQKLAEHVKQSLAEVNSFFESDNEKFDETSLLSYVVALNFATTSLKRAQQVSLSCSGLRYEVTKRGRHNIHQRPRRASPDADVSWEQIPSEHLEPPQHTFAIWLERFNDVDPVVCCPRASFADGWLDFQQCTIEPPPMFVCHCEDRSCFLYSTTEWPPSGLQQRQLFSLLPSSLLVSTASKNEWTILVGSSREANPVLLVLKDIATTAFRTFQQQADRLALLQASIHVAAGLSTLAVTPLWQDEVPTIRALKIKTNTLRFTEKIYSALFETNGRQYAPKRIDLCQLLFSKCVTAQNLHLEEPAESFRDMPFVELLLLCKVSEVEQHTLFTVRYDYNTQIIAGPRPRKIQLDDVICTCVGDSTTNDNNQLIPCSKFTMEFMDRTAAEDAFVSLQAMQRECQLSYLCSHRWGEQVLFTQDNCNMNVADVCLSDACVHIVKDPNSNKNRMIIKSGDKLSVVCIDLTETMLKHLIDDDPAAKATSPASVVRVGRDNTTVERRRIEAWGLLQSLRDNLKEETSKDLMEVIRVCLTQQVDDDAISTPPFSAFDNDSLETSWHIETPTPLLSTPDSGSQRKRSVEPPKRLPQPGFRPLNLSRAIPQQAHRSSGHTFGALAMSGYSSAVLGDVIHNYNYTILYLPNGNEPGSFPDS